MPIAIIHSHIFYNYNNTNDIFSSPGNVASGNDDYSDTAQSDKLGLDYYLVTPLGNLRLYISGSGNDDGILISSNMPVHPRFIYKKAENTLIWKILNEKFSKATDTQIRNAMKNNPYDLSRVIKQLERYR